MPYLCKKSGEVIPIPVKSGFVLAGMRNIRYKTEKIILEKREKLILYTDGITEAENPQKDMYGAERLMEALGDCTEKTVDETVRKIVVSVENFAQDSEQADDITVLAVERL